MERMMQAITRVMDGMTRRRPPDPWFADTLLSPSLRVRNLTWLGSAPLIGVAIYVITGDVMRGISGPLVIMGLFVSSFCACVAAYCYAEFSSRAHACGSAYVYTYITIGEIWGFSIGWTLILEHLLGAASVTKLCSQYINTLCNGTLYQAVQYGPLTWHVEGVGTVPDVLSPLLAIMGGAVMSLGTKSNSRIHTLLCIVTAATLSLIVFIGLLSFKSWLQFSLPKGHSQDSNMQWDIFVVASTAYFAFANLEIITMATEETTDSRYQVPFAILLSMITGTLTIWGVSTIIILMVPYHRPVEGAASLADDIAVTSHPVMRYVIIIGGIAACFAALLALLFAVTRMTYLLAIDGFIFGWFARLTAAGRVPCRAALVDGIIVGFLTMIASLKELVEVLSLGTLIAHNAVMISVILTRYQVGIPSARRVEHGEHSEKTNQWLRRVCCDPPTTLETSDCDEEYAQHDTEPGKDDDDSRSPWQPTEKTSIRATVAMVTVLVGMSGLCLTVVMSLPLLIRDVDIWTAVLVGVFGLVILTGGVLLILQPRNDATFPVMVPWVPFCPLIGVFLNVLLTVVLVYRSYWSFVRVIVWLALGILLYGLYGYRYSTEALKPSSSHTLDFMKLSSVLEIRQQVEQLQPRSSSDSASETENHLSPIPEHG